MVVVRLKDCHSHEVLILSAVGANPGPAVTAQVPANSVTPAQPAVPAPAPVVPRARMILPPAVL